MRPGVRLGIDVGSVRIGVARCDRDGLLATPVETVPRGTGDVDRIRDLARDEAAIELVVGLPRSMSGAEGQAAQTVRVFVSELAAVTSVPIRLVDERLTTVGAARDLRSAGVSSRSGRAVIDQVAAVMILQGALDFERATARRPGEALVGRHDAHPPTDRQGSS